MSNDVYTLGDMITSAFFGGVVFVAGIVALITGLGPWFESGILILVSIVLFTLSFTLFRIATYTAIEIKKERYRF